MWNADFPIERFSVIKIDIFSFFFFRVRVIDTPRRPSSRPNRRQPGDTRTICFVFFSPPRAHDDTSPSRSRTRPLRTTTNTANGGYITTAATVRCQRKPHKRDIILYGTPRRMTGGEGNGLRIIFPPENADRKKTDWRRIITKKKKKTNKFPRTKTELI